jgi:hypothetical protein
VFLTELRRSGCFNDRPTGPDAFQPMASITVYNRSGHSVEIRAVGWVLDRERSASIPILSTPSGASLPGIIGPRSQGLSWIPDRGLVATLREQGKPPGTQLRAYADDGEGHRHLSKPFPAY